MKNLLFFLFLIPVLSFGQTDDYSVEGNGGKNYLERTYTFALGPDTLDASSDPDTLIIDFDQSFYGLMNVVATVAIDSLASGGTTINTGNVHILESPGCATCPWDPILSLGLPQFALKENYLLATSNDFAGHGDGPLNNTKLRVAIICPTGKSAIRTWVTLKPL